MVDYTFEEAIERSEQYLYDFFKSLSPLERRNIGLMGGWAVHLLLSKKGVKHIGSRDIDIFFNPDRVLTDELFSKIESLKFEPHSTFRWAKYVQLSTGKELSEKESKDIPVHDLIVIYMDIATSAKVGSRSMYQPILAKVFGGESDLCRFKELQILTPASSIMVEMKLSSALKRKDSFKVSKDVADLFAMLNYDLKLWIVDKNGDRIKVREVNRILIKEFKAKINQLTANGSIESAASMLKIDADQILQLLKNI